MTQKISKMRELQMVYFTGRPDFNEDVRKLLSNGVKNLKHQVNSLIFIGNITFTTDEKKFRKKIIQPWPS